ncbi:MAG: type II toxin-antitoxin system HigB family toxin [Bacteroidetes bacterium]|nr:type II toxin-antitoxin system HigB family toxin [Bacteroidota bacterium]
MVVISKGILVEFGEKHPDSADALNRWYEICKKADWNSLNDVKTSFSKSVDFVGSDRYVFNIGGNKYRLVVMMFFNIRTMYIRFIGTHAEYNKVDCPNI